MTQEAERALLEAGKALEALPEERWHADGNDVISLDRITTFICHSFGNEVRQPQDIARFIAWTREGVPALATHLRAALDREAKLREALGAAKGYMMNAVIDIETSTKKAATLNTLRGGIKMIDEARALVSQQEADRG